MLHSICVSLIWINSMMFLGLTELQIYFRSNGNGGYQSHNCGSVPFDDLNKITFSGAFLMLVGFFFAFLSLIDAYFFKDPIQDMESGREMLLKKG